MARTLRAVATDIEERMAGEEGGSISRCGGVVPALLRLAYRSAASGYDAAARGKVPSYAPLARLSPGELRWRQRRRGASHPSTPFRGARRCRLVCPLLPLLPQLLRGAIFSAAPRRLPWELRWPAWRALTPSTRRGATR